MRNVQLTRTPDIDEQSVKAAPHGEHLLLVWQENLQTTKMVVMDRTGNFLGEPISVERSLPQNDDLTVLANGDVCWVEGKEGESEVTIVRVRTGEPAEVESSQ